jgi:hypothetical protein
MLEQLVLSGDAPLPLGLLMINLGFGVLLSLVLRWHFRKFGSTLSNREEFAQVFPFILLTTILIITVVKSSLALSLGLVGALSIVRFRTPIKEPEELAYLFMAIAMGLGLGANQTIPTIVASISILGVLVVLRRSQLSKENKNLFLSIDWQSNGDQHPERYLERLNETISKHVTSSDLRRYDVRPESVEATYLLDIPSPTHLSALMEELRGVFPNLGISFLDQNQMPSV